MISNVARLILHPSYQHYQCQKHGGSQAAKEHYEYPLEEALSRRTVQHLIHLLFNSPSGIVARNPLREPLHGYVLQCLLLLPPPPPISSNLLLIYSVYSIFLLSFSILFTILLTLLHLILLTHRLPPSLLIFTKTIYSNCPYYRNA